MFKNTAQKLTVFAFADAGHASLDAGEPVTGDAANITCKVEQDDDGIRTAVADTNPTETEDGQYVFDVTAAECNGDKLTWYPESATAGVQVVAWPNNVIFTRPANFPDLAINASGHVERVVLTDTTTTNTDMRGTDSAFLAASAPANFSSLGINGSGHVSRVTTVDTTTANTDMRGTDSALLAANVPSNFSALGINVSGHVSRVTTVDTTTANTDMRGTDSALLASSAPTNWSVMVINGSGEITTSNPASGGGSAHTAEDVRDLILAGDKTPITMATNKVSGVVTVDTTTANTDMRGTDGANTTAPDNASIALILADTNELQTNQGQWATATGFSTFNAASDNVIVNDLTAAALAKFLTEDTGETVASDGSVGKISQGSAGGNVTVGDITTAALAKFASTDSGESTAVTGSVAKLSQGSGGGSGTVVVLPSAAVVPDRSDKKKLQLFTGETITQSISVYEYDETTAVDLTGESLEVVFETEDGTDITVVASGDITIGGASNNVVSFATPAAVTNRQRVCLYAIRRESDGYVFGYGNAVVTRVAGADV